MFYREVLILFAFFSLSSSLHICQRPHLFNQQHEMVIHRSRASTLSYHLDRVEPKTNKKVFVCTDTACEQDGAYELIKAMETAGVLTCEMGCPGRCGLGPIIRIEQNANFEVVEGVKLGSVELGKVISLLTGQHQ